MLLLCKPLRASLGGQKLTARVRFGGQNEGNKVALTKGASSRLGRGAVGNNSKPGCVSVRTLFTQELAQAQAAPRPENGN